MDKEMIVKRLKIIQDLQEEMNHIKEHYEESLENNPQYMEIKEQVEKVRAENKEKEQKILDNASYKALSDQLKEKRQELKENKGILSQELLEYYKSHGTLEIEDADGTIKQMKFSVRLVR